MRVKPRKRKPQSKGTPNPLVIEEGVNPVFYSKVRDSVSSPRTWGRAVLRLQQNPHIMQTGKLLEYSPYGGNEDPLLPLTGSVFSTEGPVGDHMSLTHPANRRMVTSLNNRVLAKFNKKIRNGTASLGVTLATVKQSRDMFHSRITRVSNAVYLRTKRLQGNPRQLAALRADIARDRARNREPVANLILETEFGWRPLYDDLDAAHKMATSEFPNAFTRAGARQVFAHRAGDNYFKVIDLFEGLAQMTYSADVQVTNPNAYLRNKLGLANPLAVAWDLVPWSFVVNMFVNVNQFINVLSNEVGLRVTERHLTTTVAGFRTRTVNWNPERGGYYRTFGKHKVRKRVNALYPDLQVRLPKFSWETVLIAASLCVQRINKLNQLIRV